MADDETMSVGCEALRPPTREGRSNSQVLDHAQVQQLAVGPRTLVEYAPDTLNLSSERVSLSEERSAGTYTDASGRVVPRSKLPLFLTPGLLQADADDKLRRLPLAMHVSVHADVKAAKAHDGRALFVRDDNSDTRMPVYIVDQGEAHWSRETSGNIWPDELSRIRHAIGGDIGASCVMMLVEMARALSRPQMFVIVDGADVVQLLKPRRVGRRLQLLVQRPPGLTTWLTAEQLNAMAGTDRNQTRSHRITLLHQVDAILVEERQANGRGDNQRFLLNPLLFKGNSAVIEAVNDAARERWHDAVNIANAGIKGDFVTNDAHLPATQTDTQRQQWRARR